MDEVVPGLWLGDIKDARKAPKEMVKVCVLETCLRETVLVPRTVHIPILVATDEGQGAKWYKASTDQLNFAAKQIDFYLRDHKQVLVHCWAGEERSPLTVAWYLKLSKHISMDEAYAIVKEKHPQTFRRDDDWLQPYVPVGADIS